MQASSQPPPSTSQTNQAAFQEAIKTYLQSRQKITEVINRTKVTGTGEVAVLKC